MVRAGAGGDAPHRLALFAVCIRERFRTVKQLHFLTADVKRSFAMAKGKNPHAVALGRKGGKKGGAARAANLTPEERSEAARKAVRARWAKAKAKKT